MYWEGERRGSDVGAGERDERARERERERDSESRARERREARAASFTRRSSTYDKATGRELRCAARSAWRDARANKHVRLAAVSEPAVPARARARAVGLRGRFSAPRPRRPYAHALYAASPHSQYVSISPTYPLVGVDTHSLAPGHRSQRLPQTPRKPTHERRDLQIADGPRSIGRAD